MNESFDLVRKTWMPTQAGGIVLVIILGLMVGSGLLISRPPAESPLSRRHSDGKGNRRVLRVCYSFDRGSRQEIDRNDLMAIARTYNMLKNEKPVFDELLRLNENCKVSSTAEALKCTQSPCQPGPSDTCPGCVILVPMRD